MFSTFKVKDLKKLFSVYREHHNIKGYSKMTKNILIDELEKRFIIHDNQIYLKTQEKEKQAEPKQKKRITPQIVGKLGSQNQPQNAFSDARPIIKRNTNAIRRALKKADELEAYYKARGDADEYPDLAF